MSILAWDKSLEIGHEKIDAQHKSLVELINRVHAASVNGDTQDKIKSIYMELYKYTLYHFNEEEMLMGRLEYPIRNAHKLEHEAFVKKLDMLSIKSKDKDLQLGTETFRWLVEWLLDHISVTDKQLVACLRKE